MIGAVIERNEAAILQDTLDHVSGFCDEGILVLDDASTDRSPKIAYAHDAVHEVIQSDGWDPTGRGYKYAEFAELLAERAIERGAEWIAILAADERIELDGLDLTDLRTDGHDSLMMPLFDAYMTPEDHAPWYGDGSTEHAEGRKWWGPGYRYRTPIFRLQRGLRWRIGENFAPVGSTRPLVAGSIRHMGKGISVERWDADVEFYIRYFPHHAPAWLGRRGKGIRGDYTSLQGRKLIRWAERGEKGRPFRC